MATQKNYLQRASDRGWTAGYSAGLKDKGLGSTPTINEDHLKETVRDAGKWCSDDNSRPGRPTIAFNEDAVVSAYKLAFNRAVTAGD